MRSIESIECRVGFACGCFATPDASGRYQKIPCGLHRSGGGPLPIRPRHSSPMARTNEEAGRIMGAIHKNVDAHPTEDRAGWFESKDHGWKITIGWDGLPSLSTDPDPVVPPDEEDKVKKLRGLLRSASDQIRKRHYLNATRILLEAQGLTLELFAGVLRQ